MAIGINDAMNLKVQMLITGLCQMSLKKSQCHILHYPQTKLKSNSKYNTYRMCLSGRAIVPVPYSGRRFHPGLKVSA